MRAILDDRLPACRGPAGLTGAAVLMVCLVVGGLPAWGREAAPPFCPGERLLYDVHVWLGWEGLGMRVGTAEFLVVEQDLDGRMVYQIRMSARGGAFGYRVDSVFTSLLDAATLEAIEYSETHRGTEKKQKRLLFTPTTVSYWRYRRVETPDGRRTDRHDWVCQRINEVDHPFHDMLSALYLARGFDLREEAGAHAIDVADTTKLWRLTASGSAECELTVPAGRIQVIPVRFTSTPLNTDARKKKFSGLLGMKGDLQVWVDAETHRIVRLRGTIPLGIDLRVDISLAKADGP